MEFHRLQTGGSYQVAVSRRGAPSLSFLFETRELGQVERFLSHMYVELSLRVAPGGGLAFCLQVPDRDAQPWSLALRDEDLPRLREVSSGLKGLPTFVRSTVTEELVDLSVFGASLELDWSGRVARAYDALASNRLSVAEPLLERVAAEHPRGLPSAHHLLGRCRRQRGDLSGAISCYGDAVRAACEQKRMLPYAAGPLSDMGVAFKMLGDMRRAIHCFLHSLALRPNHPEALLSLFSMFSGEEPLVLFAAARVFAIGRRDALAEEFLDNYARSGGRDGAPLIAAARAMAARIDLQVWPLHADRLTRHDGFERGLLLGGAELDASGAGASERAEEALALALAGKKSKASA